MWQIWLIIAGICFIIEIMTVGFLIFWFAIGALLTMVVSLFTNNIIIQTSVFIISSTILIFATKPFVQKFVNQKSDIKTNVYSKVGKTGIVTKDIDSIHSLGQVKVEVITMRLGVLLASKTKPVSIPLTTLLHLAYLPL